MNRTQELARHYPYVLQCDIRQFFPSIDHAILSHILARKIADDNVLWLIDRILESGRGVLSEEYTMVYFPGDDLFAGNRPRGLPIHPETHQHPVADGMPFLGFVIFPQRRRLKRREGIYFQRKLRAMMAAYDAGETPLTSITASVQGWVNHVRYGNTVGLRKAVLG